jgi:hypothetical protein
MSYSFAIQPGGRLLVVVLDGDLTLGEEEQMVRDSASYVAQYPEADVLVDRRRSKTILAPRNVQPHLELIQTHVPVKGNPKLALLVGTDYDFGMARMFELIGGGQIPHRMRVFRSLEDACHWLDISPGSIEWPDP